MWRSALLLEPNLPRLTIYNIHRTDKTKDSEILSFLLFFATAITIIAILSCFVTYHAHGDGGGGGNGGRPCHGSLTTMAVESYLYIGSQPYPPVYFQSSCSRLFHKRNDMIALRVILSETAVGKETEMENITDDRQTCTFDFSNAPIHAVHFGDEMMWNMRQCEHHTLFSNGEKSWFLHYRHCHHYIMIIVLINWLKIAGEHCGNIWTQYGGLVVYASVYVNAVCNLWGWQALKWWQIMLIISMMRAWRF